MTRSSTKVGIKWVDIMACHVACTAKTTAAGASKVVANNAACATGGDRNIAMTPPESSPPPISSGPGCMRSMVSGDTSSSVNSGSPPPAVALTIVLISLGTRGGVRDDGRLTLEPSNICGALTWRPWCTPTRVVVRIVGGNGRKGNIVEECVRTQGSQPPRQSCHPLPRARQRAARRLGGFFY